MATSDKKILEMSHNDLEDLSKRLKSEVIVKDRRYFWRLYKQCFVGSEVIDWLLKNEKLKNRNEGKQLGQKLMDEGLFRHISEDQQFEDGNYFYNFNVRFLTHLLVNCCLEP